MTKIGLVLSGGGLKGNAHIGVLQALQELGVKPDVLTGTSAGSIVVGMYINGMEPSKMLETSTSFNKDLINFNWKGLWKTLFSVLKFHPTLEHFDGIFSGSKLDGWFTNLYQDKSLKDFTIPFAFVSTDLTLGREVVLSNTNVNVNNCICVTDAKLSEAVRASISVPVVFTPVVIGDMELVDGGVLDNLPVDAARALGADKIIGVNLDAGASEKKSETILQIGGKAVQLLTNRSQFYKNFLADVYINPNLSDYTSDDFSPIDAKAMYEIGYKATMDVKDQILELFK